MPVPKRHLEIVYSHINSDSRTGHRDPPGAPRMLDDGAHPVRDAFSMRQDGQTSIVNCNRLRCGREHAVALRVYARANQAVLVTPFIMAGAMAPASAAGAIAQLNAEALAGIAYGQLERPGSPMVYGSFVTTVSMQSGAPMMGTAEPAMMIYACCQLARRYKLP